MPRYDWVLQYRNQTDSWESLTTPTGALENKTPGQAEAYLGQWITDHPNLVGKLVCLGLSTGE